ncbi:MAG: acyl carrier protein [Candidatus Dormiibacterota bacterium]
MSADQEENGSKMKAEEALKLAFAEGLGLPVDDVDWPALAYRGIPEWDSVAHMQVVAEIEDAFDIMLEIDDVVAMSSFEVAKEILTKYGVSFSGNDAT